MSLKRVHSVLYVDSSWVKLMCSTSFASLVHASQSSLAVHSCLSPCSLGTLMNLQLIPSATTLRHPGLCRMSTILWARMASLYLAWVEFSIVLRRWSQSARQSVSSSTGYPHMMLPNMSNVCFSAVNSRMKCLYFSSASDVRFDENAMG